jgi:hypothetical protein
MSDQEPLIAPDNTEGQQAPRWQPGESGNPNGRPKGSRNRISEAALKALADDFDAHDVAVIEKVRTERPHDYLNADAAPNCPSWPLLVKGNSASDGHGSRMVRADHRGSGSFGYRKCPSKRQPIARPQCRHQSHNTDTRYRPTRSP